jgi:protein-L-isoaspartate O-methyltransferase
MRQYFETARSALGTLLGRSKTAGGSLAYRKNKDAIWKGDIPKKYTRLIEFIPGNRILEIGAAEGVLSLLLARDKEKVIALEFSEKRHKEALQLQASWRRKGFEVDRCQMVHGDIKQRFDLLPQVDTLVAVRVIYHLHEDIHQVFENVGKHVQNVVLCGNKNRARRYFEANGKFENKNLEFDYYASVEGMTKLLEASGYRVTRTVDEGDPIVVAERK